MLLTMMKNGEFLSMMTSKPIYYTHIDIDTSTNKYMTHLSNSYVSSCRMLFELLVLSGAQVGSDWTTILKKRQDFRLGFAFLC